MKYKALAFAIAAFLTVTAFQVLAAERILNLFDAKSICQVQTEEPEVPNLVGKSSEEAEQILEGLGFSWCVEAEY
ncbi:MAG: PASTA domain-containing protein [Eubacteriaceae bacterium]|nr:PASTA domain-containing protein [Eubacteriaceae bacterium]